MSDDVDRSDETYRTVAGRGEAAFEVRGSEFVGRAAPAEDREAAEAFVAEVQEAFADATHNVPAYRVRADPLREWASDDGEPSGSAGKPALNVLQQEGVENVAVVVTRYYGGTNLGVGGLARAYSRAVKEALEDAGTVEERPHERFSVTVEYDDSGTVRGIVESEGAEFDADYAERVTLDVRVPVEEAEALRDRIRSATSGRAEITDSGQVS
ncbi:MULTISPECIES: IMPACT family protein [Halorussus]|uniref:IMPACT family protein n=1 Tax=Halorussus TaxID=1070314 RepID=UPI00209CC899|nr:YigZ family protein [Halorussus vallis]USZ74392.1 IMPACT family protein [Halorussus vallis]